MAIFIFATICITKPMKIASVVVWWMRFASGGDIKNNEAREAVDLMGNDPEWYEGKYSSQLAIIKLTGWVGLFVSLVGFCTTSIGR